ncbi:MAG: hypothetical protein AAF710_11335 [Planctomycetota bacterium]
MRVLSRVASIDPSGRLTAPTRRCGRSPGVSGGVRSDLPDTRFGSADPMIIGGWTAPDFRGLMSFDLSSIPAGATIRLAQITFTAEAVEAGDTFVYTSPRPPSRSPLSPTLSAADRAWTGSLALLGVAAGLMAGRWRGSR